MESLEPKPEVFDQHLMELLNHAQIELMQEYARENNITDFEVAAREWILKYATDFRHICNNKDCFEGIERTHEATMATIKKELYKK